MEKIAEYFGRQILWLDYNNFTNQLPDKDWICLAISNSEPDPELFNNFVRVAVSKGILEFKGHGQFEKKLYDLFDQTVAAMQAQEGKNKINVISTRQNDQTLAQTFWQCFFATGPLKTTALENIKIVCVDIDGVNRREELKSYIKEFELGWLPSDNIKHEIWENPDGLTTLSIALKRGNEFREFLEPGSKLIHTFYASTYFEAMTIYYKFMNWGEYKIDLKVDEKLCEKNCNNDNLI